MQKFEHIYQNDAQAYILIERETKRQAEGLELIASENYASSAVLEALATPFANKYSEGYPGKRYYGGNEVVDSLELLAIERAKQLFCAEHVNVQPLSGSPANMAVYMAMLKPGDKVLGLRLDHGGHLSHGHPVNFSGIMYDFAQYELDADGLLDMNLVADVARRENPKMIVAGYSAYSRAIDWKRFRAIADEVGAILFADISHTAGLIAGKQLENPVPICDIVMTTTHKTLRGPRGAIIMCKEQFATRIDKAVFPGLQGGPHDHVTLAKAVALAEALRPEFVNYAREVIVNAKAMSDEFSRLNYDIISGGTDTHLFVLDLRSKNLTGKEAEKILEQNGISVSRSTIPNDTNPPMNPSGLRIGTPAVTTRGFGESECRAVAGLIDRALRGEDVKEEVKKLAKKFSIVE